MNSPSANQSKTPSADADASSSTGSAAEMVSDRTGGGQNRRPRASRPSRERAFGPAPSAREFGGRGGEQESLEGENPIMRREPWKAGHSRQPVQPLQPGSQSQDPRHRAGVRKCPGCESYAYVTSGVCPECGEELQLEPQMIRCSQCGQQANSELVICPHCARGLKPAPSRLWTVGAPALLVLLFGVILVGRMSGFSLSAAVLNGAALTVVDGGNGAALRIMTPVPAPTAELAAAASEPETPGETGEAIGSTPPEAAAADEQPTVEQPVEEELIDGAEAAPGVASASDADTDADTESAAIAAVKSAAVEALVEAPVSSNAEWRGIGGLAAGDQITESQAMTESQPDAVVDVAAAAHDEQADALQAAGNSTVTAPETSDEEDELVVQAASALLPSSTPGVDSDDAYRLASPSLRSPADGSVLDCDAAEKLVWLPVPYMEVGDSYVLHLGFVAGRAADGSERVSWVLAQPRPANMTSWELDAALCNLAPADYGRQWRWWVEATQAQNGQMESISPPSAVWTFIWD